MEAKTKKGLMVAGLAAAGVFIAYKVIMGKKTPVAGESAAGGISTPTPSTSPASVFSPAGAKGLNFAEMAGNVFSAMDGMGTDEDVIYFTMSKLTSDDDLNKLYSAYGKRTLTKALFFKSTGDLYSQLREELDSSQLQSLNDILAANGITQKI